MTGSTGDVDSGVVELDRASVPWRRELAELWRRRDGEALELRRASLDERVSEFLHMAWPGSGDTELDPVQSENVES